MHHWHIIFSEIDGWMDFDYRHLWNARMMRFDKKLTWIVKYSLCLHSWSCVCKKNVLEYGKSINFLSFHFSVVKISKIQCQTIVIKIQLRFLSILSFFLSFSKRKSLSFTPITQQQFLLCIFWAINFYSHRISIKF